MISNRTVLGSIGSKSGAQRSPHVQGGPNVTQPLISRLVRSGWASDIPSGEAHLLEVLRSKWPTGTHVKFLVTPGGYVAAHLPERWRGGVSWQSGPQDLKALSTAATSILSNVITPRVLKAAIGKVDVITIGIDLLEDHDNAVHAELVALYEVGTRRVHWTGKSYPTASQERRLIQVTSLETHLLTVVNERVLVLGCHDLNMFSPRGWANQSEGGLRRQRCTELRQLAKRFRPTVVLQHPHRTDSPSIWRAPWAELQRQLPDVVAWASGIAYYHNDGPPRAPLEEVLAATHGQAPCVDFVVQA